MEMRAEITSLLGLEVYTQKGVFVGKVDDAVLDPEKGGVSGLALGSFNKDLFDQNARGVIIPYRWVTAVGDVVIMKHLSRAHAKKDEER
jgi:sporulation protein YlmC with PRC-barrel domain